MSENGKKATWTLQSTVTLVIGLMAVASLIFPNIRDTPTRAEMEDKIEASEQRIAATIAEMSARLIRIENLLLEERSNATRR